MFEGILGQLLEAAPFFVALVIAIVEGLKRLGVKDWGSFVASMVTGLVLGLGYSYSLAPITTFAGWFFSAIFGLILGLTASGLYTGVKSAQESALKKLSE